MAAKGVVCSLCNFMLMAVGTPETAKKYWPDGCPKCLEAAESAKRQHGQYAAGAKCLEAVKAAVASSAGCFKLED